MNTFTKADLNQQVYTSLGLADTMFQKPQEYEEEQWEAAAGIVKTAMIMTRHYLFAIPPEQQVQLRACSELIDALRNVHLEMRRCRRKARLYYILLVPIWTFVLAH